MLREGIELAREESRGLRGRRPRGGTEKGTRSGSEPDRKVKERRKTGEVNRASSGTGGMAGAQKTTVSEASANAREVTASRDAATSPMSLRPERSFMPAFASRCGRERGESVRNESLQARERKSNRIVLNRNENTKSFGGLRGGLGRRERSRGSGKVTNRLP